MDGWFQGCAGSNGFTCGFGPGVQYREEQERIITSQRQQQLYMQMNMEEAYTPQSVVEEVIVLRCADLPSSSASSLCFLSEIPECSALALAMPSASCHPEVSSQVAPSQNSVAYEYQYNRNLQMPNTGIIDTAPVSNWCLDPFMHQNAQEQARGCGNGRAEGVFRPYSRYLGLKKQPNAGASGQRMIKMALSFLTRIRMARLAQYQMSMEEARLRGLNQRQHVMSERRRREKLNKSFHALEAVLPPASKKDKPSILVRAKEHVKALKSQVSELEEKKRMLESQLQRSDDGNEGGDSGEKIEVQITRSAERTQELQEIYLKILVSSRCNFLDAVVRMLQCLKEMGGVILVAMNTSRCGLPRASSYLRAIVTLQLKSSNWDEELLKEYVMNAVKAALRSGTATP